MQGKLWNIEIFTVAIDLKIMNFKQAFKQTKQAYSKYKQKQYRCNTNMMTNSFLKKKTYAISSVILHMAASLSHIFSFFVDAALLSG